MDAISNVDRLVSILRQRLAERPGAHSRHRADNKHRAPRAGERASAIAMLAAVEGVEDQALERALIQNAMIDQFGSKLVNEAKFQRVVDQVVEVLRHEPETCRMLTTAVKALRDAAR